MAIPREAAEQLGLRPGQRLDVIVRGRTITLVPIPQLEDMVGILHGKRVGQYRDEQEPR